MPKGFNKGKGPYDSDSYPETIERDGIKLINGRCEPLYEFDLREYHNRETGMPADPPETLTPQVPRRRK